MKTPSHGRWTAGQRALNLRMILLSWGALTTLVLSRLGDSGWGQDSRYTNGVEDSAPPAPVVELTEPGEVVWGDYVGKRNGARGTQAAHDELIPSEMWIGDATDQGQEGVTLTEKAWESLLERLSAAEARIGELEAAGPGELWIPEEWVDPETGEVDFPMPGGDSDEAPGPSVNVTGQVQIDFVTFNQSANNKAKLGDFENATGFRRARLGAFGEVYDTTEYRVEFDFASTGRPRFLDNWIAVKDIPYVQNIIVGHFFEPFSLERYTPNRFITFNERAEVDVFAPARNTGLMFFSHTNNERVTWAYGLFRSNSNSYGDSINDSSDWAGTSHVTWLPWFDEETDGRYLLHVGASYSVRLLGDKEARFRNRPYNQLQAFQDQDFPAFADTGAIAADEMRLLGLEMAWVHGPFSAQAEYVHCTLNRLDGADPDFWAAYVYVSYFLTGENRSYSPASILGRFREGIFQRITPNTNAFAGNSGGIDIMTGPGAWEIAARVSHIDLNSAGIEGNSSTNLTVGVNWYLNANTRIQWNWVRPFVYNREFGHSTADLVSMRFGYEW
jgi:phosphate-selective porin OprO and OprP